jgi:hypothetical protein
MADLTDNQLQLLANKIRKRGLESGNPARPTRVDHFNQGRAPHLIDIHQAVLEGNITKEEGMDLNSKYTPDKVIGEYSGGRPRYQRHTMSRQVQERAKGIGMYKKNKGNS